MPDRQSQTPTPPAHSTRRLRWLVVLGLVGVNVLLFAMSSYLLWRSQQQHEKRAETLTQNVTKAVELNVVKTVAAVDLALQAVVDGLEAQLAHGGIQPDATQKLLATYEGRVPAIEAIRVSRFDGLVIYGRGLVPAEQASWADRDEFKLLQSQPHSGLQITEARIGKVAKRAIIDAHGTITKVNQAWLKFATDNGATQWDSIQPGANYFEVCVGASTSTAGDDAAKVLQGIQAVMNGQLPEFTLEYPCHSPHVQRWYVMRAVNLAGSHKGAVLLHQDVTQRHRAEDLLKASEERFHLMFDTAIDAMILTAPDGRIFAANSTACTLLQRTEEEIQAVGRNGVVDTTAPALEPALQTRLHDGRIACELTFVRKDGTRFLCDVSSTLYNDSTGQRMSSVVFRDITERKRIEAALRESEARMAAVFKASPLGIAISRLDDGTVMDINDACARLFGFEREEIIGRKAVADLALYRQPAQRDELVRLLREHATFQGVEVHYKTHADQDLVVEVSARLIEINQQPCVLAVMLDVTEKKREQDLIHAFAFHDALTQLPNRRLLTDRLKQAIFNTKRHERVGALMYLDLDNFKPLNDTHGHEVGDLLLQEVAQRLTRCVREIDTVARVGGDEFVVLLSDLAPSRAEAHELARAVAEKILTAVAAPYQLIVGESADVATVTHHCSVSVGVALFAGDASSHTDILNWADAAMYQAKHAGRNTVRFHSLGLVKP
ncbi:diguanylate cyclase [Rhodoferax sp.]|uniref:diguanylate cyclase domain-containing protein n=1 Tax=Rhodoferax sp. TaxID=50421 RepID=UPI002609899E|nr:diguanylate cyclase [Rhodoferax sp.]MDD5478071.1 diguanylate cyclase [Rhodoferax sp.]